MRPAAVDPGRCHNYKFFSQGGSLAVSGLQVLWALPNPIMLHPGVVYAVAGRAGSKFQLARCVPSPPTLQRTSRHLSTWGRGNATSYGDGICASYAAQFCEFKNLNTKARSFCVLGLYIRTNRWTGNGLVPLIDRRSHSYWPFRPLLAANGPDIRVQPFSMEVCDFNGLAKARPQFGQ